MGTGIVACQRLALLIGSSVLLGSTIAAAPETVSVHVAAAVDAEQSVPRSKAKELSDSAEDLRKEIPKRQGLSLAKDADSAHVVVLILDRRIDVAGTRQDYGGGNIQLHYQSSHVIVYRIRVGSSHHDAEQIATGSLVTWRRVAKDLSKHLERWVRENREQILRSRTG